MRIERHGGIAERAACTRDHRERGAQVVRDGGEEGIAKPLRFRSDARLFGLILQAGALQCERNLGRKRLDQVPLLGQAAACAVG